MIASFGYVKLGNDIMYMQSTGVKEYTTHESYSDVDIQHDISLVRVSIIWRLLYKIFYKK